MAAISGFARTGQDCLPLTLGECPLGVQRLAREPTLISEGAPGLQSPAPAHLPDQGVMFDTVTLTIEVLAALSVIVKV